MDTHKFKVKTTGLTLVGIPSNHKGPFRAIFIDFIPSTAVDPEN
jgi:hypothetical protein